MAKEPVVGFFTDWRLLTPGNSLENIWRTAHANTNMQLGIAKFATQVEEKL